jgi:hypothetical protein
MATQTEIKIFDDDAIWTPLPQTTDEESSNNGRVGLENARTSQNGTGKHKERKWTAWKKRKEKKPRNGNGHTNTAALCVCDTVCVCVCAGVSPSTACT